MERNQAGAINMKKLFFFLFFFLALTSSVSALEEDSLSDPLNIVIIPFELIGDDMPNQSIEEIIRNDLNRSVRFKASLSHIAGSIREEINFDLYSLKDAVILGKINKVSDTTYDLYIYIYDIASEKALYQKKILISDSGFRKVAHYLSDKIYEILLDAEGSYSTSLAYVEVKKNNSGESIYDLQISDSDGFNPQTVVRSSNPISSPAWSPDQKQIAYIQFINNQAEAFITYPFKKNNPIKLPRFDGITSEPSWHPNGESLLLTLSKNGNQDIYSYGLKSKTLERITVHESIDTEANYSPDGRNVVFMSKRSGKEQIYIKNLESKALFSVPIKGNINSNSDPVFSPDGTKIALIHKMGGESRLALFDIKSNKLKILTKNKLDNSPSFSPSGEWILFSTTRQNSNSKILSIISLPTNQIVELMLKDGSATEPTWLNFSKDYQKTLNDKEFFASLIEEKRSETAQKDQKIAEQEALKEKAKKVMAEVQRKANEEKEKIPKNATGTASYLKCKIGYITIGNKCLKAIENGKYDENSSLVICDTGYRWMWNQSTGGLCKRDESLIYDSPSNSILAGNGWKCITGYYKYGFSCLILPLNSKANKFDGFTCSSNYTKIGNGCILIEKANSKKIETKLTEKTYEVEFWNSIKDSDDSQEYQIYLEEYPEGKFVKLAELRIRKLDTILISDDQTFIPKLDYGNYHALVIGNDKYKYLNPLSNAVNDAKDVATLLRSKYHFNVNVLTNATRDEIVSALSKLRNTVSVKDNILVYYAGHGIRDEVVDEGYWLPIDAQDNDQVHWISNETIMRSVKGMNAKHVMIVADSCFSGTLTRGVTITDKSPGYIIKMVKKKARTVLTSGGLEPVSDSGGDGNSIFASSFLRILDENNGVLEGNQLFTKIRKQVRQNSDQTPEYGSIRKAGHDGGDFLFVRQ